MHGNLTLDSIAVGCFCVSVVGWLLLLLVVILISNGFLFPFCDRCDMELIMITQKVVVAFHVLVSCDPFFELPREIHQLPLAHLCIIVFCFPVLISAACPLNNNMSCTSWLSILFDVISPKNVSNSW